MSGANKNNDDLVFNENFVDEAEPAPPPPPPPPPPSAPPPVQPTVVDIPSVEPETTVPVVEPPKDDKPLDSGALAFTPSTAVPAAIGTIQAQGEGPSEPPINEEEEEQQQKKGRFAWLSLQPFKCYFNVDTKDVLERLLHSLRGPFYADFVTKLDQNPDLYGPFWIATTLIFLTAVSSNVASYTDHKDKKDSTEEWDGHYSTFIAAAFLFYIYVFLLGLIVYFGLRFYRSAITLVEVWCVYGYALSTLIPAVFLMCLSQAIRDDKSANVLTIVLALVGTLYSGSFLLMNFRTALMELGNKTLVAIFCMAACHVFLGVFLALYFHKREDD